ncbi:hypothetical protein KP001_19095 [Geomonas subterranea]|uniref:Uncharacterized protein n=1 Tax=Geomonas subterranea TaxID=2847989 RepID=A0ABX8LES0_9BACT|nr:hypothetical protein [Geomonas subterranea]QXE90487.1 hypothetical protein KP001_19095 [Geomonas subterranea]QXM11437.1 hypothetical protein KP002_10190 [Geomonas subterranea]
MGIIDKIKGRIQDRLNDPAFMGLVQEQSLKDLLLRREFRITQEYLQREFLDKTLDDELVEFKLVIGNGYCEVSGRLKKRLVPFALPFSASFAIEGIEFSAARKCVFLKLGPVSPLDLDWLTGKVVQRIPALSMMGEMLVCDLNKVPRLAELFAHRVKGISIWDYITLKELWLKQGEIGGRVGVVL